MKKEKKDIRKITFYVDSMYGVEAYEKEDGTIERRFIIQNFENLLNYMKLSKYSGCTETIFSIWKIILIALILGGITVFIAPEFLVSVVYFSIFAMPYVLLSVELLIRIHFLDGKVARFYLERITHDKAENAYSRYKRVPTHEEILKESIKAKRYNQKHEMCISQAIAGIIGTIITCLPFNIAILIGSVAVSFILIETAFKLTNWKTYIISKMLYPKPTKEYLNLSIIALEKIDEINRFSETEEFKSYSNNSEVISVLKEIVES